MKTEYFYTALLALLILVSIGSRIVTRKRWLHWTLRREARKAIKNIKKVNGTEKKIEFLRSIHHFAFEELILCCFKRMGWKIIRNKRYTGDGGIDGIVWYKGEKYLIQAKRYSGPISYKDVQDFYRLTILKKCKGFFIHTGKTPQKINSIHGLNDKITFLYGKSLVEFIEGDTGTSKG